MEKINKQEDLCHNTDYEKCVFLNSFFKKNIRY